MQTGLDQLITDPALLHLLAGQKIGVLAHPASVDRELRHIVPLLDGLGLDLRVLFGPEHGFGGEAQDMAVVGDVRDEKGRLVRSLYGDHVEDLIPKEADLRQVDVLLIDLQDIGSRYYTFVWTALLALEVAARIGIRTIILDRPNPLGIAVEGRVHESRAYLSFVGLEPIPIRHGLTLGELVAWQAGLRGIDSSAFTVIDVKGIAREALAPAWDRAFVLPSPNMPTFETALVYPGGCLIEGTNLSEGRGTTRPFEIVGAPGLDGTALAKELENTGLLGFRARPMNFLPTFQKHAGTLCGGVQIHVTEPRLFRPVAVYTALISAAHALLGEQFRFRTERYEFVDDIPAFDLLTGGSTARSMIVERQKPRDVAEFVSDAAGNSALSAVASRRPPV